MPVFRREPTIFLRLDRGPRGSKPEDDGNL